MIFDEMKAGLTVHGQPIAAYRSQIKGSGYLYLIGGTHGDEVEGVFVLKELFDWLKLDHSLPEIPMVVIPILNIDGYEAGTRVNSHAVDLNRNYPTKDWSKNFSEEKYNPGPSSLSEPENIFLNKLFEKYPPRFIVSFHSWKPVINFNGDCEDVAKLLSTFNHYPVDSDIGYATPGSLGTYGPEKFNCPVITFECPVLSDKISLKDVWKQNERGLKELFRSDVLLRRFR